MSSDSRTVFVTGGAGYVGSHCCKAFSEAGWNVIVYDNLSRGWADFVKWGPLIEGDLLDRERLSESIKKAKPDAVAHFAALAYVGESVKRPDIYYRNNVIGSINLLNAMRRADVKEMVFSSTCATYGDPQYLPIDELHPQNPINPYGSSKLMIERVLRDYSEAFGIRSVALRYFNAAGADPDGEIGERHEPETHLIPLALKGAGDASYTLGVFGYDYDTKDGSAVRDYIHVSDLADAHLRALEYLQAGGGTEFVNLGTGRGVSVLEIKDAVERVTGARIRTELKDRRTGDPASLVSYPGRAKKLLGWECNYLSIEDIVEHAWRWYRNETSLNEVSKNSEGAAD